MILIVWTAGAFNQDGVSIMSVWNWTSLKDLPPSVPGHESRVPARKPHSAVPSKRPHSAVPAE